MSISSIVLEYDGTTTTTGATTLVTASNGPAKDRHTKVGTAGTLAIQPVFEFVVVRPKASPSAPNGFTQGRREITVKLPILLANGKYTTNTLKMSIASDIEVSDSLIRSYRDYLIQLANDSDLDSYYNDLAVG